MKSLLHGSKKDEKLESKALALEPCYLELNYAVAHCIIEITDMLYAIISEDVSDSLETRLKIRPAHLKRLEALKSQGRLVLAGPHPAIEVSDPGTAGFTGSLVVAEFPSLKEAKTWAEADPYNEAGVYAKVTVKPFKKVLP